MLITLVLCWTVVCLLLGDATDEVRMIAVSSTASTAEEQLPDACISEDDVVALFDALKLKISSSPERRRGNRNFSLMDSIANEELVVVWWWWFEGMFEKSFDLRRNTWKT